MKPPFLPGCRRPVSMEIPAYQFNILGIISYPMHDKRSMEAMLVVDTVRDRTGNPDDLVEMTVYEERVESRE